MSKRIIEYIKTIDVEESAGEYAVKITLTSDDVFIFPVPYPVVVPSGLWKGKEIIKMPRIELIKAFNELGEMYQKNGKKEKEKN